MTFKLKSGNNTSFKTMGSSPVKTHEAGHTLADSFTRTTYSEPKFEKKKRRKKKIKNFFGDIGEGLKNYGEQVVGKRRPKGWCPKGGKCGSGPGVQKPSLPRRLWPFRSLRKGGSSSVSYTHLTLPTIYSV